MYDPLIKTFITVADCGSFTSASEKLYISPTAVMKQINTLESRMSLTLLSRNSSGVELTKAGKVIYLAAKDIIERCENAIQQARKEEEAYNKTFCVGTSLLNPAKPLMDLWYLLNDRFPGYKLHLVPFDDNNSDIVSVIDSLGEKFDFLVGACNSKTWMSKCNTLEIGKCRFTVAVSRTHRLARKTSVSIADLEGETVMMVKQGDSSNNDKFRKELISHGNITVTDMPSFYDMTVFNRCAETDNVLISLDCWRDIHPELAAIPLEFDFSIPLVIMYSKNAPDDIKKFISAAEETVKNA